MQVRFLRDAWPRFENLPQEVLVSENADNDSLVLSVSARDDDVRGSLVFELHAFQPAAHFFHIQNGSNEVRVREAVALKQDKSFVYKVSWEFNRLLSYSNNNLSLFQLPVVVWDDARPQKTATSTLTCRMLRNEHAPVFREDDYSVTLHDRLLIGSDVFTVTADDEDEV